MIEGLFAPRRFLDMVRDFIVFEEDGGGQVIKKMAGYHRFHAVQVAIGETLRAASLKAGGGGGDRRIGVVWHTQGSGKSLTMVFYAGRIIRELAMENPTVVVLTDRNDLDDQLCSVPSRVAKSLLRQTPVQAAKSYPSTLSAQRRSGRRCLYARFTSSSLRREAIVTRLLSERRNIVVIADEAHRSQYDFIERLSRGTCATRCRVASFIGFTGTPIELPGRKHARCVSVTTSASTTFSAQSKTVLRYRSITRADSRRLRSTSRATAYRPGVRRSSQKARRSSVRRNSRADGHDSRPLSARRNV